MLYDQRIYGIFEVDRVKQPRGGEFDVTGVGGNGRR